MKSLLRSVLGLALPSTAGLLLCGGCSILPTPIQTETLYYDLRQPAKIVTYPVEVENFVTTSGERFRMARRRDATTVYGNEFHKWIQTPGSLLTKYLRLAFRSDPAASPIRQENPVVLSGEVLTFEAHGDYAEMGVRYQLKYGSRSVGKTVLLREKLHDDSPKSFADAMSVVAERFARMVGAEAQELQAGKK